MSDREKKPLRYLGQRSRLTEDELLLKAAVEHLEELSSVQVKGEAWRVFRIMGEFVEGFDELTHLEVLKRNLKVMDSTAISLCMDNELPIIVFNLKKQGNILRAVNGEHIGTRVGKIGKGEE